MSNAVSARPEISRLVRYTVVVIASIGFLFDIYEILVGPLIVQPALLELGNLHPGTPEYRDWAAILFWVPPLVGGFFGFCGGYFTDRFGRRRVLTWSILIYSAAAFWAGNAASLQTLLIARTLAFAGSCVEFVAAVAWLAEIFTEPKQREAIIGYTQAFSSLGGALSAEIFYLANQHGLSLPAIYSGHSAWRYLLISGMIPALPLIFIRPFLPESPEWEYKRKTGTLKRPSVREIFTPQFRKTSIVSSLMLACAYGCTFGALQQAPQIAGMIPEVAQMAPQLRGQATATVQGTQEIGGLIGRVVLAALALIIVSRRTLLRLFLIPAVILMPLIYFFTATESLWTFRLTIAIAGFFTVSQLSFWGIYLPRMYPVHLRGTGEGFAINVGGRMIGTSTSFITTHLSGIMPGTLVGAKLAYAAAIVGTSTVLLSLILTFFLPEPPERIAD
jgi:MFS family permease